MIQAVVQKPRASLTGTCFIKLKPAEKERLKAAAPQMESASDAVESGAIVEDSDQEGEDEEEEIEEEEDAPKPAPKPVPVPEPEPEPVKKKVVRKTK